MPIQYTYQVEGRLVRTRVDGRVAAGDFVEYCESVLADDGIEDGFIEVLEVAADAEMDVRFTNLRPFPLLWRRYLEKGVRGTLILARSRAGYGIFRMFQAAIDAESVDPDVAFEVVDTPEALERRVAEIRERFPI